MPIFALLKEICIVEQNLKNVWLVIEELLTISHNKHFNAFEVEVKPNQELVLLKPDDLSYGFPPNLNLLRRANQDLCLPKIPNPNRIRVQLGWTKTII